MFSAEITDGCYVRTYVVEAATSEEAMQVARNRWPYRDLDKAIFRSIGNAFESSECMLPDH